MGSRLSAGSSSPIPSLAHPGSPQLCLTALSLVLEPWGGCLPLAMQPWARNRPQGPSPEAPRAGCLRNQQVLQKRLGCWWACSVCLSDIIRFGGTSCAPLWRSRQECGPASPPALCSLQIRVAPEGPRASTTRPSSPWPPVPQRLGDDAC